MTAAVQAQAQRSRIKAQAVHLRNEFITNNKEIELTVSYPFRGLKDKMYLIVDAEEQHMN